MHLLKMVVEYIGTSWDLQGTFWLTVLLKKNNYLKKNNPDYGTDM